MNIAKDAVVSIHYTLTNDKGETLDSSAGGDPLAYIHGHGKGNEFAWVNAIASLVQPEVSSLG